MGVVYRARDTALERVVAIKMPHRGVLAGGVARPRFEREARVLAQLRHPNIVPVHAAGLADGRPYFVMDYVPRGSLAGQAAGLGGQAGPVADVVEKVARAVDHAHQRGVLHRDLKPSNILLDERGQPLVCDFGLAALLDADCGGAGQAGQLSPAKGGAGPPAPRLTHAGAAVGTPAYMAPEQFAAGCRASRAADVWALGVIFYELLTGRLPFAVAPDPGGEARGAAPPRPSALRPGLDHRLDAIVLRCLAQAPGDRYASAGALADDIARWRGRGRARKRGLFALALGLALAAAAGIAYLLTRPVDEEARHRERTRPAARALTNNEPATLIPGAGPPVSLLVREGKAFSRVVPAADGAFSVYAAKAALFELLPEVGVESYSFSAEVREDGCMYDADLGLYFAHQQVGTARGTAHLFGYLRFADLLPASRASANDQGRRGSRFAASWLYYREPGTPLGQWMWCAGPSEWYEPPPEELNPPGPWRKLSVEVTPERVRGRVDDVQLAAFSREGVADWVSVLPQLLPELSEAPRPVRGGGLGLYVNGCQASFKNCRVVPLVNP
jgi:hypothetical protein